MKVLVYDDNLIWSVRLERGLRNLGHEPTVLASASLPPPAADAAILNLGNSTLSSDERIAALTDQGTITIGHAGHKEREVFDAGLQRGCQHVVTNSQLTHKLAEVMNLVKTPDSLKKS